MGKGVVPASLLTGNTEQAKKWSQELTGGTAAGLSLVGPEKVGYSLREMEG